MVVTICSPKFYAPIILFRISVIYPMNFNSSMQCRILIDRNHHYAQRTAIAVSTELCHLRLWEATIHVANKATNISFRHANTSDAFILLNRASGVADHAWQRQHPLDFLHGNCSIHRHVMSVHQPEVQQLRTCRNAAGSDS